MLKRWRAAEGRPRQIVCVGDSITRAFDRGPSGTLSPSWVDLLATALGDGGDSGPGEGFRGLWRDGEWTRAGAWTRTDPEDDFDLAPFGAAFYSSGNGGDRLTWSKPPGSTVAAFDLYSFHPPGTGDWQYRVDDGEWRDADRTATATTADARLRRVFIDTPVHTRVEIRGRDTAPSIATIAGIRTYAPAPTPAGTVGAQVHNLGVGMQFLTHFCRRSAGDPLALLDDLRPEVVILAFSNDVLFDAVPAFEAALRTVVERVEPYGDVLLIGSYEQRPPRTIHDATISEGTRLMTSETADFLPSDLGEWVSGIEGMPSQPPTVIAAVEGPRQVRVSAAAPVTHTGGEVIIGRGRESAAQAIYRAATNDVAASTGCAHLDIYDDWGASGEGGWASAYASGLMVDRYHASAFGHRAIAARLLTMLGHQAR